MATTTTKNESSEDTTNGFEVAGRFYLLEEALKAHTDRFIKFIRNPELLSRNLKLITEKEGQFLERLSGLLAEQMKSNFDNEFKDFLAENCLRENLEILDKIEQNQPSNEDYQQYQAWRPPGRVDETIDELKCQVLEAKIMELKKSLELIKRENNKCQEKIRKNHEEIVSNPFVINNAIDNISDKIFIDQ